MNQIAEEIAALEEANPGQEFGKVIYQRPDGSYFTSSGWGTPSPVGNHVDLTVSVQAGSGVKIVGNVHNHASGNAAPSDLDNAFSQWLLDHETFKNYTDSSYTVFVTRSDGDGVHTFAYSKRDLAVIRRENEENRVCDPQT